LTQRREVFGRNSCGRKTGFGGGSVDYQLELVIDPTPYIGLSQIVTQGHYPFTAGRKRLRRKGDCKVIIFFRICYVQNDRSRRIVQIFDGSGFGASAGQITQSAGLSGGSEPSADLDRIFFFGRTRSADYRSGNMKLVLVLTVAAGDRNRVLEGPGTTFRIEGNFYGSVSSGEDGFAGIFRGCTTAGSGHAFDDKRLLTGIGEDERVRDLSVGFLDVAEIPTLLGKFHGGGSLALGLGYTVQKKAQSADQNRKGSHDETEV